MIRILVIDDVLEMRELLHRILEREKYTVVSVANGKEAIKVQREDPFDLIITDLIMPEKEGIETIIELRQDYPDVKIIAISGGGVVGPKDYLSMAKMLGANRTLPKPFARKKLLETVRELVS